ncbi:MAG: glutamine synthetase [Rhodobacterales bacterium]|nr:MAG: glutamine synthetase [Rhodobacterales bacterium]PIE12783.1 MAG: glutamine synthetase [Rhodobacterales bacterium]
MSDFITEYQTYCDTHGRPDRVELMLADMSGILRGKWLPGEDEEKLAEGSVRLPQSTYAPNILGAEVPETGLGIVIGDPDGRLYPVAGSLKPVPWQKTGSGHVAQVLVEMHDEKGELFDLSARGKLAAMVARFAERGWKPVVATELEFYLHLPRDEDDDAPTPPPRSPDAQNYDLEVLERAQPVLDDILAAARAQNLAPDTLIAEYGPGQFEINFHHTDDVMEAADAALTFRRLVRGVARTHGLRATFMAKPYTDHPGNGMHAHISVVDENGQNIFDDGSGALSDRLKQAVAGTLATMEDMQAIFAPHMNSYRRFQAASFAPSAPDWGYDNRAAGVRLPDVSGPGARLEHRICGADVNPHLALTAILGGMLYGLDTPDLPLPKPLDDADATPADPLTADWLAAVDRFATSELAADLFGLRYRDIFTAVKRDEIAQLTTEISQVEYRTYLGRL